MKNLLKKLSNVRKATGFIKKEKVGSNLSYKAVSADMALSEVRPLIDKENLFLSTQIISELIKIETKTNDYGKTTTNFITSLELIYTWYDVDSGESLDIPWKCTAQNTDPAKSNGSALTYAEKYFLLKYFNIISSENIKLDPDAYSDIEDTKSKDINNKPNAKIPEVKKPPETKPESLTKQVINDIIKPMVEQVSKSTEQKPEVKKPINWISADGKKTVPEENLQNMVATSFNNVLTQPLKVEEKKAQLTELKEKYINGFQGLSLSTDWFNRLYQESLTEAHSF